MEMKPFFSVSRGNIDAQVIVKELYLKRIEEGSFLEMVTCYLSGTKYCLKDTIKTTTTPSPIVLGEAVVETVKRDWKMTEKYFEKGNVARGKKTLVHTARMILVTLHIIAILRGEAQISTDGFITIKNKSTTTTTTTTTTTATTTTTTTNATAPTTTTTNPNSSTIDRLVSVETNTYLFTVGHDYHTTLKGYYDQTWNFYQFNFGRTLKELLKLLQKKIAEMKS